MKQTNIESVCVFGSTARFSADRLSDRDVLVIASDKSQRDDIVRYWRQLGWSVSVYSPSRFLKMLDSGSLFIHHLKVEGLITEDKNRWLENHLDRAEMKRSYALDAQDSVSLALPMERLNQEKSINQQLIAADLAYISVRNYGICYLADRNRLTFAYSQIVEELGKDFMLNKDEISLLQSMRIGKVSYRNGLQCSEITGTVGELRKLLSKFFSDTPLGEIEPDSPIRNLDSGYATLRDFEAWMVSAMGLDAPTHQSNKNISTLKKWICSPQAYSWSIKNVSARKLNTVKQVWECSLPMFTNCESDKFQSARQDDCRFQ